MADVLYFEDFKPGQTFKSGQATLDAAAIKAFARQYDPQPFHTDEEAAKSTFFGGLAASGWNTAGVMMRLLVEGEFRPAGGVIGGSIDEFRWPKPVRPGDTLTVVSEIVETRESKSRADIGTIRARHITTNQSGDVVLSMIASHVVQRRRR